ncbi:MAG: hypothetical protein D6800_05625 [Candidatus Zixiibacteriota bacterium]|nr:MAG: hypothetical protein D6800_05625 [candidate division Zixibacteria bacterium]
MRHRVSFVLPIWIYQYTAVPGEMFPKTWFRGQRQKKDRTLKVRSDSQSFDSATSAGFFLLAS